MPQPNRYVTARLTFRKGTTAEWAAADPILMAAEPCIDTTLNKFKIGDGVSRWSQLEYIQNMAATSQEWSNTSNGSFPSSVQTPEEAINYLSNEQSSTQVRVTALEAEIDGGTF